MSGQLIDSVPATWIDVGWVTTGESMPAFRFATRGPITSSKLSTAFKIQFCLMVVAGIVCLFLPWDARTVWLKIPVRYFLSLGLWWGATCMLIGSKFMPRVNVLVDSERQFVRFLDSTTGEEISFGQLICIQICSKVPDRAPGLIHFQVNLAWRAGRQLNGAERIQRRYLLADARRQRCDQVVRTLADVLPVPVVDLTRAQDQAAT